MSPSSAAARSASSGRRLRGGAARTARRGAPARAPTRVPEAPRPRRAGRRAEARSSGAEPGAGGCHRATAASARIVSLGPRSSGRSSSRASAWSSRGGSELWIDVKAGRHVGAVHRVCERAHEQLAPHLARGVPELRQVDLREQDVERARLRHQLERGREHDLDLVDRPGVERVPGRDEVRKPLSQLRASSSGSGSNGIAGSLGVVGEQRALAAGLRDRADQLVPLGRRDRPSSSSVSTSSWKSPTSIAPYRRRTAEKARPDPTSAPVWVSTARAAASERPTLRQTTGLPDLGAAGERGRELDRPASRSRGTARPPASPCRRRRSRASRPGAVTASPPEDTTAAEADAPAEREEARRRPSPTDRAPRRGPAQSTRRPCRSRWPGRRARSRPCSWGRASRRRRSRARAASRSNRRPGVRARLGPDARERRTRGRPPQRRPRTRPRRARGRRAAVRSPAARAGRPRRESTAGRARRRSAG